MASRSRKRGDMKPSYLERLYQRSKHIELQIKLAQSEEAKSYWSQQKAMVEDLIDKEEEAEFADSWGGDAA